MYKAVKKIKVIRRYMEYLALHTGAPTVHWEYNTSCIFVVEAKIVTPRVKHVEIPVCFLQEQFDNGIFIPKHVKSSVMPSDMCTKLCSGPIISLITKWMTIFILYPTCDTEHYQLTIIHYFVVN